jgi:DNA-binding transcriptional LysR family regulator
MLNLRHIEVFHAVYANGSVMGAARELNVSQPSISKVLAHAESRLGFPLFRRVRGRLVPTEEAHILFREAEEVQVRIRSIHQTAKNLRGGVGAWLRLAVLPALGLAAGPAAVAELLTKHPASRVDIQTLHHDEMVRSLLERDCDLAVGYDLPDHPRLERVEVAKGELVVLFRRDQLPDPGARVDLAALDPSGFITLANSGPLGTLFSSEASHQELDLDAHISVRTFYVAAGLVRAGAGMAVIDEYTARASVGTDLDFRPIDPPLPFRVEAMHLSDRPPSRLAATFLDALGRILAAGRP